MSGAFTKGNGVLDEAVIFLVYNYNADYRKWSLLTVYPAWIWMQGDTGLCQWSFTFCLPQNINESSYCTSSNVLLFKLQYL